MPPAACAPPATDEAVGLGVDFKPERRECAFGGVQAVRFLNPQFGGVADSGLTPGSRGEEGEQRRFVDQAGDEVAAGGRSPAGSDERAVTVP